MTYLLAIGDRTYSSWSLRGWLMFDAFGIDVEVRLARMYDAAFAEVLAGFGGARTVPALRAGEVCVWDTLAIAETLAEAHPDTGLWPADPPARGLARSIVAEMHSGFAALRSACPMNLSHAYEGFRATEAVIADLARIEALWARAAAMRRGAGPWLFGAYSLADVFYAPVAARIAGYGLPVGPEAAAYVAAHLAHPSFRRWRAMGVAERRPIESYDLDLPRKPWPGPDSLPAEAVSDAAPENAVCPFSGRPVQPDSLGRFGGRVIGFCNRFCRDKAVADPLAWPRLAALLRAG